ncbi:RNA polymerase sigma factor [Flavobacteriaceae bacterium MHTCC 0001]
MTNEEIIDRIVNDNDTALFEILYDRFSKSVYNKCYSFVKNQSEAEDLTHDIFLKVFMKLEKFNGKSKFSTWLYSLTYNHCVNYVNRHPSRKYETRHLDFIESCLLEETEETEDNKEVISVETMAYLLNNLASSDKDILLLKYQNNLSIKDIQEKLGLSSSAVKMRIKRAKERFSTVYAESNGIAHTTLLKAS